MRATQIYVTGILLLFSFAPCFAMKEPLNLDQSQLPSDILRSRLAKTSNNRSQKTYPTLPSVNLRGHEGAVMVALFNATGNRIASGSNGTKNNLMIWDTQTATLLHNCVWHEKEIYALQFTPNGKYLVSGSDENNPYYNLAVWNVKTGKIEKHIAYHINRINDIQCNTFGLIASCSSGNTRNLALWNIGDSSFHPLVGHEGGVDFIRFTPDGQTLASSNPSYYGGPVQTLFLWNVINQQIIKKICFPNVNIDLAFNNDCSQYAANRFIKPDHLLEPPAMNCILTIWDMQKDSQEPQNILIGHRDEIIRTIFSRSNKKVISSALDTINNLILWDNDTGNIDHNLVGHSYGALSAQFSPDEHLIVSGSYEGGIGNLLVWKTKSGKIKYNLIGHESTVYNAHFSPDGNYIISAGGERSEDNPSQGTGELILWFCKKTP